MIPAVMQQRRWQMSCVLLVSFLVAFLDRINVTFALPLMAVEYGWTEEQVREYGSLLMGLFYAGYGIANIFLTPFAAKIGPRRSLLLIIVLWSVFTALGAWVSQWIMLLLATRVLLGLSEGVHVPMMSTLVKTWFPREERARANSIIVSGVFLSVLLAPVVLVPIMSDFGWRAGFLLLAGVGVLISLPLVYWFVYDHPDQHSSLTAEEKALIAAGREREAAEEDGSAGWLELFAMPRFVLFMMTGILNNLLALGFTSWMPTYFTNKRGIPFEEITWLVAAPYAFSILGLVVWSFLGDRFNMRAAFGGIGFALAGAFIYVALGAESLTVVILCMSAAVFSISAYNACEFAMVQRLMPMDKIGPAMGIYNGLTAIIGGGLGPLVVSPIIGDGTGTWIISVLALINGMLLFQVYRLVRY